MKNYLLFLAFLLLGLSLFSQLDKREYVWRIKFANCQYDAPRTWEYDPFGSYEPAEWNQHGSSVCPCTGVIHIDYDQDLYFVFYPSLLEDKDSESHLSIWGSTFIRPAQSTTFSTRKAKFTREASYLQDDKGEKVYDAWRYTTQLGGHAYLFYFFAKEEVLERNADQIKDILESVRKSKKLSFEMTEEVKP